MSLFAVPQSDWGGSPVPNSLKGTNVIWVPAGLLDGLVTSRVSVHLHTSSAALWEQESNECVRLEGGPESLEALNRLLMNGVRP